MRKRLESQVMAVGKLEVFDIVSHSINQDDFMDVQPSLTQASVAVKKAA